MRAEAAETGRGERMVSSSWVPSSGCTLWVGVWAGGREWGQAKAKGNGRASQFGGAKEHNAACDI